MKSKINYLNHSGFTLETPQVLYVFDLYTDPAGILASYTNCGKPVVFFVSHSHYDHWNSGILSFTNTVPNLYIIDNSCRSSEIDEACKAGGHRLIYVDPYMSFAKDELRIEGLNSIHTFGSTDEGVSFLLDTEIGRIYHAGDLNEWDWQDEDTESVKAAYRHELGLIKDALSGDELIVAFVPVDQRLGETAFSGVKTLLEYVLPRYIIPMHLNGGDDLPGKLRRELRSELQFDGTHVVSMTLAGMPFDLQ